MLKRRSVCGIVTGYISPENPPNESRPKGDDSMYEFVTVVFLASSAKTLILAISKINFIP